MTIWDELDDIAVPGRPFYWDHAHVAIREAIARGRALEKVYAGAKLVRMYDTPPDYGDSKTAWGILMSELRALDALGEGE